MIQHRSSFYRRIRCRLRRRPAIGALCLGLLGAPSTAMHAAAAPASDAGSSLQIRLVAPQTCADSEFFRRAIVDLLGEKSANTSELQIDARLKPIPNGMYQFKLALTGAALGSRTLQAKSCEEALEAGALIVALAIDPDVLSRKVTEPVRDSEANPSPQSPEDATGRLEQTEPMPSHQVRSKRTRRVHLGVSVQTGTGLLPFPQYGIGLHLALSLKHLRFEAGGEFSPPRRFEDALVGSVGYSGWGGGVRICYIPFQGDWTLAACAGAGVARVSAEATQNEILEDSGAQQATVVYPEAGLRLARSLTHRFQVFLSSSVRLPTEKPSFVIERQGASRHVLHRVHTGISGALGVELRF